MKNDKKCVLKSGPNGNKCAKKPVKKVVKKVAKPNVAKVIKCGLNPDTGRCKIGMKHVGRCELRLAKDGTKNCTKKKLVLKKQKAPKKKIIIKKTAIKKNIKDNSVPHGKYKLTLKEAKDCGVNPVSGRCKFGMKEDGKCKVVQTRLKGKRPNGDVYDSLLSKNCTRV